MTYSNIYIYCANFIEILIATLCVQTVKLIISFFFFFSNFTPLWNLFVIPENFMQIIWKMTFYVPQHYVMAFVIVLWVVGDFLCVLWFLPSVKLTPMI